MAAIIVSYSVLIRSDHALVGVNLLPDQLDQIPETNSDRENTEVFSGQIVGEKKQSWLASQLFDIENSLGQILSREIINEEDRAEVRLILELVFKNQSILRQEKISLTQKLWSYAEQNTDSLLLLQKAILNYKPKELTDLMLRVLSDTANESLYISTLNLLRESHSHYYATGRYDDFVSDDKSLYQAEDVLSFIEYERFDSDMAVEAFTRTYHQFSPLDEVQAHWQETLSSDLTEGESVDAVDDFYSMFLGRKDDQNKILELQFKNIDAMNEYARTRFVKRLWQLKTYESNALSAEAVSVFSRFLGNDSM